MTEGGLWPLLLAGKAVSPRELSEPTLSRLADLIGASLAQHLLAAGEVQLAAPAVTESRLANRFRRADGLRWAHYAADHGVPVVCLKGLAAAHLLYPDPDLRTMSDADLLIMPGDLERLQDVYEAAGLSAYESEGRSPWGHISDASLFPFSSADAASNIDLHIHPDAWPVHLGLPSADVFTAAQSIPAGEGEILAPSLTHMLLLCASHAARDLFGPSTAKSMIDAVFLLRQYGAQVDWQEFQDRLRAGRTEKPVRAFLAMLEALGADIAVVPEPLRRPPPGAEFARARRDYIELFPDDPGMLARARRELLLCAEPDVAVRRNWLRLSGLIRRIFGR